MPKLFSTIFDNVIRRLERKNMKVQVDGWRMNYPRSANSEVLLTPTIHQEKRVLVDSGDACGKINVHQNPIETTFIENRWVANVPFLLSGSSKSKCSTYVRMYIYVGKLT
ncbi:hypothetical protein Y032_0262g575 [Ancylostoma ceylanicum]|uniref:Uncharacterized protein n=1 Tax=Ancylostoma ceylanicum TaxID=53326 RepID=A0A016SA00_9BILA|nr:hypothetical protein Y032_0262g575 [Ancylostoma ceylanicum]